MSRPVLVRTRAPCEPPRPIITGFSTKTIQLYWEKPLLYSVIGRNQDDSPKYLKLSLEGYRLMINDKPHMRLGSSAQSCTLVKCKPGKTYKIVLVACTCTEEVKKERKRKRGPGPGSSALDESFTTSGSNHTWHTDNEDFENDESPSEPIEVTLPNLLDGQLSELSASYLMPSTNLEAPQDHKDCGDLQIDWGLQEPDLVKQVKVVWQCPGASQSKVVDPDVKNTTVPIDKDRRVYDVLVTPEHTKDVTPVAPQRVQVLVPGSPDAPEIWTRSVDDGEFVIEWGQPRCYGVKIGGYQVYMNGKKVGNQLSSHHRKAVVPCKPKRQYRVNLVAVSADNRFSNSEQSNLLLINTGSKYGSTLLRTQTATMADDGNHGDHPEDDYNIRVVRVTEATIHLDWGQYTEPQGIAYYRVVWSSVAQTAEREVKLPAGEKSCVIHKCYPGTNHFLRLYTMGTDDAILDKSRMLTVQTSAPPDPPNVRVRACNFKYIAIQWDKPTSYGDAKITGYKIYVNGVVEALQGAEQFTYSHTQGQWCKEYVFQVQALTATDKLSSKPSEPLVVTWPGISPPSLRRAPSVSTNAVKVVWDLPASTDGVKVKQFKVVVLEEVSEKVVQIISPIHPGTSEADIHNLRQGKYLVYLEVHVHGSTDVVKSDVLRVEPCLSPNPPAINVTVIGLEERRAIEKITCQLVNKRDRLLNVLGSKEMAGSPRYNDNEQALVKAAEALTRIEDMLDDCLHSLDHYTGHLMAHVSWTCPQSSDDITVSGYKVLVDGKQYGTTLHNGIKSIRVKLGLDAPSHKISMVSVSEHPHTTSAPSNGVEVITEPFLPFSFFTFFSQIKMKNSLGPLYSAALTIERRQLRRPVNQGLLRRHIPPPFCSLMDLVQGQYRPLFPPSGPRTLTAVLFWSKWCPYSTKTLSWFVRLARSLSSQYEFVAVACEPREITAEIRQDLLTAVTDSGWREDSAIRHVLSQCQAEGVTLSPGRTNEINGGEKGMEETQNGFGDKYTAYIDMNASYSKDRKESVKSSDVTELFGVLGVPSLVVIHPQDYIAWKGRYCAFDYASFEYFTNYVFGQVLGNSTPMADPWDADIDTEALNGARKARPADKDLLIHRPTSSHGPLKTNYSTGSKTTIHVNGNHGNARPVSAVNTRPVSGKKKLFHKSKAAETITVNSRPFSATVDSPYAQRVRTASPPRRAKSGRKHKTAYY